MFACISIAQFLAYRNVHQNLDTVIGEKQSLGKEINAKQRELEKLETPSLVGEIETISIGTGKPGRLNIHLNVSLRNFGADSTAYAWHLKVNALDIDPTFIPDGATLSAAIGPNKGKVTAIFHGDFRLEKRVEVPIKRGQIVGGWLMFRVPMDSIEQLSLAPKTLYFKDVNDHEYSVEIQPRSTGDSSLGVKIPPGSGDSPFVPTPKSERPRLR